MSATTHPLISAPPLRMTPHRQAVLEQLRSSGDFRSAQQVHSELAAAGTTIGLATVYRSLAALSSSGEIDELKTNDGESLYRHCATRKHHHHLVCRECGKAKEISGPRLENFLTGVAESENFADLEHVIEIWGTCADCVTAANRANQSYQADQSNRTAQSSRAGQSSRAVQSSRAAQGNHATANRAK